VKQKKYLVLLVVSFSNLPHLSRRGLTFVFRRFSEEFEESLPVLIKTALVSFEVFLQINKLTRMEVSSHLHVSMLHVEKLADLLMLLLPIYPLTSHGTVHGGLASSAVLESEIRRRYGAADDAALRHECCWNGVRMAYCNVM
jgi:hypothetical protein